MGIKDLAPESRYQINIWASNQLGKGEVVTMEFETKESGKVENLSFASFNLPRKKSNTNA